MDSHNKPQHIADLFHKEKNQKKNNKTKGQHDKLRKYGNKDELSTAKSTTDKMIRREAKFLKNIHIDSCYEKLRSAGLISNDAHDRWRDWYFKAIHTLGPVFVEAQAQRALNGARDPSNPAPLFHFLINKEMNKASDPYMPRFGRAED